MSKEPLVSVITPVYNGEAFLQECIESVLGQTYGNFEYLIVNNCSKDRTLEIASTCAKRNNRIRVQTNDQFVGVIENHNIAFRLISRESKYCKVVCADDWLFPECIARMVDIAEGNPSVGIVGSYQLSGGGSEWSDWRVRWDELPYPSTVIPGRQICRAHLLGCQYVFGSPTSILYRADLVRGEREFFPNASPHADTSACYKYLRNTDFGFAHQVLSYERVHNDRQTATSINLNAYLASLISDLLAYGSSYLTEDEMKQRLADLLDGYYRFLGNAVLHTRNEVFWRFHREKLAELGYPLDRFRLGRAAFLRCMDILLNPKRTVERLLKRPAVRNEQLRETTILNPN
jgi:glycosyltransferase involved in cell wall biosynthesis